MALHQPKDGSDEFVSGASEERFQAIAEASPDAYITIDITGRIRYWNDSAAEMFGYSRSEILGASVTKLMPARFKSAHLHGMSRFYTSGTGNYMGKTVELSGCRRDGSEFPMELSLASWQDRGQVFVTGAVRDITQRKVVQRDLFFRSELLDSATDSVFVTDRSGRITFANRIAIETRGYRREELVGMSAFELTSAPFRSRLRNVMRSLFAGGDPIIFESEHRRRDGSVIPIEVHARAVSLDDDVIYTAVVRDISERLRRERFEAALGQINETLAGAFRVSEVMSKVMEAAAGALGTDSGCILEAANGRWSVDCLYGMNLSEIKGLSLRPSELGGIIDAAQSQEPSVLGPPRQAAAGLGLRDWNRRSIVVVPIVIHNIVEGVACFAGQREASFGPSEKHFAQRLGLTLSLAWENERLHQAQRDIADVLQDTLLTLPEHLDGVAYAGLHRSATEAAKVGGDFYDLVDLGHGRIGITIGDIVGKGIGAAAMTSLARSSIAAYAYEHDSPAKVMSLANRAIISSDPETLLTAFYGVLSVRDGRFVYCSAGHPPPFIVNGAGLASKTNTTSPMLGLPAELHYIDEQCDLAPGDKLMLYTDGVTESRRGVEFFGEERLMSFGGTVGGRSPRAVIKALLAEVGEFTGDRFNDDIALLCVERLPNKGINKGSRHDE